jgi:hypothetical protein
VLQVGLAENNTLMSFVPPKVTSPFLHAQNYCNVSPVFDPKKPLRCIRNATQKLKHEEIETKNQNGANSTKTKTKKSEIHNA